MRCPSEAGANSGATAALEKLRRNLTSHIALHPSQLANCAREPGFSLRAVALFVQENSKPDRKNMNFTQHTLKI
jgi:hypothetical protein